MNTRTLPDTSHLNAANPFSLSDDDESDGSDPDSDCSSCEKEDEDFEFSLFNSVSPPPSKPHLIHGACGTFTHVIYSYSLPPSSPTEPKPMIPVRLPPLISTMVIQGMPYFISNGSGRGRRPNVQPI
ncbi:hypothetical protein M378DRAFT_530077 [Amanita muscaria Koide BX008]|uniref:Uncharacterized protein n=1 Tax=Amanita muscaria (strain Koide BX008) TaxID=946122 RepID=A0A0C2WUM1_AMAMK|nr:hypothetical protein M378DRAFT_530077 [Amanita muscaria Koide BX008]